MKRYARKRTATKRRTAPKKRAYRPKRNTRKVTLIKNPFASDRLMVKLQYPFAYTTTISQTSSNQLIYNGAGYPNMMGVAATSAEVPAGFTEYGAFYNKFRVYGSTMEMNVVNTSATKCRVGLLAVPYNFYVGSVDGAGSAVWQAVTAGTAPGAVTSSGKIADYLGATYVELLNEPFVKWRDLHESTNPRCQTRLKSSRKTKDMCGVKDIRDVDELENDIWKSVESDGTIGPQGFAWIMKTDIDDGTPLAIKVQGKITYYIEFFQRNILTNPDV